MAVSDVEVTVRYTSLSHVDNRLPIAKWSMSGSLTGDVTGGSVTNTFFIDGTRLLAADPIPRSLYSLEEIYPWVDGGSNQISFVQVGLQRWKPFVVTLDDLDTAVAINFGLTLTHLSSNGNFPVPRDVKPQIFLGYPDEAVPGGSTAQLTWNPNINGSEYRAMMWGYMWNPLAMRVGGPLRPEQVIVS